MINIDKMFICRIGWMEKYQGVEGNIAGDAKALEEKAWGYDLYNFQPYKGTMYGYVQPPQKNQEWFKPQIKLENLGGHAHRDEVKDIFIVWVAKDPSTDALKIVGYYKNATVLRRIDRLVHLDRFYPDKVKQTYRMRALEADCRLLTLEERVGSPAMPKTNSKDFGMGQGQYVFSTPENKKLRENIMEFLNPFLEVVAE